MHLNPCSQFGEVLEPLRDGSDTRKLGNYGDVLERMLGVCPSPHSSLLPICRLVNRLPVSHVLPRYIGLLQVHRQQS